MESQQETRGFGEVLRHELNNPLTGTLGNAELLLVELRHRSIELLCYGWKPSPRWRCA
jgi:nitrogen-specific signal transduction histidine kinase